MNIVIFWVLIPLGVIGVLIAAYWIMSQIVTHQANQYLLQGKQKLDARELAIEQAHVQQLVEVSQKKTEALGEYQKALEAIRTAEKIRTDVQGRIDQLTQRNTQLQNELTAARQRAQRIAKRLEVQDNKRKELTA